ncbi:hypothetical protein AN477_22755 [Alicyclobacillus ferrooxydans]|uniref:Glycosyl transferase family 1 domain-containing protein n=1 Tax=Alicyclobacillus ferrooxydans TaxID=471514 RepID=A0A0P9CK69_9BACL|nr:hypothetical protein AN477_22755 [Alicyclobacillus ferrooxydans]
MDEIKEALPVRIAWIGPMPSNGGGAGGVSSQLLKELDRLGIEVDCFVPGHPNSIPEHLGSLEHIRFICGPSSWQWGKWYSRNRLLSFITGQIANLRAENRLAFQLLRLHQTRSYDVVYQFSHIEFSALKRFRSKLPPIVLHPSVHAQGELRWHKAEDHLSKASESFVMRFGARIMLTVRSVIQKRHIRYPDLILGLSQNFAQDVMEDYRVPSRKLKILPNPIDLDYYSPESPPHVRRRLVILFVSRIAVRKGVEMVVELSHRLDDLKDDVEIKVVGEKSQWSDYKGLLQNLNLRIAKYVGEIGLKDGGMRGIYRQSDILVQPSHYEPFGLTVAEALASGIPVVVSDKVGAGEGVHELACRRFHDGQMEEFEHAVRILVNDLQDERKRVDIRTIARQECERLYCGEVIASRLMEYLTSCGVSSNSTDSETVSPLQLHQLEG